MQFVNLAGVPIDLEALKKGAKKKSRPTGDTTYHKGWIATGFPPTQLTKAKLEYEAKVAAAAAASRRMLPWDEDRYMRDTRPTKVRSKPYETRAAAQSACELAERSGWRNCSWSEVTKGSAS